MTAPSIKYDKLTFFISSSSIGLLLNKWASGSVLKTSHIFFSDAFHAAAIQITDFLRVLLSLPSLQYTWKWKKLNGLKIADYNDTTRRRHECVSIKSYNIKNKTETIFLHYTDTRETYFVPSICFLVSHFLFNCNYPVINRCRFLVDTSVNVNPTIPLELLLHDCLWQVINWYRLVAVLY